MRVNVISDLHLEFGDLTLPGGDVLILSGDVVEAKHLKLADYTPEIIALGERTGMKHHRYMRFFYEECAKYREVIYVMGNHEHYHYKFNKTYGHLKENLPANIHLLEKESVEIDGVVFIGATLWTDCNNGDPLTMMTLQHGMNDYKTVTNHYKATDLYYKLTPKVTYEDHIRAKQYISETANAAGNKPVVVVTHHSPSRQSTKPKYAADHHINGGYSSNLEEFIIEHPNIQVWTHGHTHDTFDYQIGQCRILCNPRGYSGYEQRAKEFDPTIGFDM
jgi:predicted phosphodiesterase